MDFEVTDLIEAMDNYRKADQAYDNDPFQEYGTGTHEVRDNARIHLNQTFKEAIKAALEEGV